VGDLAAPSSRRIFPHTIPLPQSSTRFPYTTLFRSQKHNIKGLDPSYVDEGFRRNDLVAVVSERRKYSFEDIAKHVIMDFIDKRLSEIDRTLTNRGSVDKFVVTGGGVNIIKDYFTEVFGESNIVFAENSQTANLKGYYKLASNL